MLGLVLSKKDHIVYPEGQEIAIQGQNIKYLFNGPDPGTFDVIYFDEQSAKLTHLVTYPYATITMDLVSAMPQPYISVIKNIDASSVNKPGVISEYWATYKITGMDYNTIFYNNGRWNSQRNKRIKASPIVTLLNSYGNEDVTGIDLAANSFTVHANIGLPAGSVIWINNDDNVGFYTVVSVDSGAYSEIFVEETILSDDFGATGQLYYPD